MAGEVIPIYVFAEKIGVDRRTVGDIVRLHHVPTQRVPYSGKGKGLDATGQATVLKLLNLAPEAAAS